MKTIVKPNHLEAACGIACRGIGILPDQVITILDGGAVMAGRRPICLVVWPYGEAGKPLTLSPTNDLTARKVVARISHDQAKSLVSFAKKAGAKADPAFLFEGDAWAVDGVDMPLAGSLTKVESLGWYDQLLASLHLVKESGNKAFNFDLGLISDALSALKVCMRGTKLGKEEIIHATASFLESPSLGSVMLLTSYTHKEIALAFIAPVYEPPGSSILLEF